jgi:hypothetical protein
MSILKPSKIMVECPSTPILYFGSLKFVLRLKASLSLHAELPANPGEVPSDHTHFHILPNSLLTIILSLGTIYK